MNGKRATTPVFLLSISLAAAQVSCSPFTVHRSRQPFPSPTAAPSHFQKLAHTYSIVAYDSVTGDLGVAVQSKFPNVGGIVPWGKAGVGALNQPNRRSSGVSSAMGTLGNGFNTECRTPEQIESKLATATFLQLIVGNAGVGQLTAQGCAIHSQMRTEFQQRRHP